MGDHVISTERQPSHEQGVQQRNADGQHPGQHQQGEIEPGAHDGGVVQGEADGHVAVIGHGHKEEVLQVSKEQEEVHLCQAASIGDGQVLALHVLQQFGHCDRGEAEVRERQVTEKQIHGCVEVGVQANQEHYEEVPQDGGNIHGQEQSIEQVLMLWLDRQAQKEEL